MKLPIQPNVRVSVTWAAPMVAVAALGCLLGWELAAPEALAAHENPPTIDRDDDGVVDAQETILGTNALRADSDEDGYSDLEELARGSSPLFPQSTPGFERLHIGLTCRGGEENLHAVLAVYLPDGNLRDVGVEGGVLVNGNRYLSLSQLVVLSNARLRFYEAVKPGAKLVVFDLPFSPRYVRALGELSLFAVVRHSPGGLIASADAKRLVSVGSVIAMQMQNPLILGSGGLQGSTTGTGSSTGLNLGSIYVPLPVAGSNGESYWAPGQVCVQQTQTVAIAGATLTQEVVSAECQLGWDGFCPPDCASSVGDTYTTVDPTVLIGG